MITYTHTPKKTKKTKKTGKNEEKKVMSRRCRLSAGNRGPGRNNGVSHGH